MSSAHWLSLAAGVHLRIPLVRNNHGRLVMDTGFQDPTEVPFPAPENFPLHSNLRLYLVQHQAKPRPDVLAFINSRAALRESRSIYSKY
jgi:hypothetical protein